MKNAYKKRRERLFSRMQDGVAILRSAKVYRKTQDIDFPFRQDSDFFYLTGFDEPDAFAVFEKKGKKTRFVLFVTPSEPEQEVWTGKKCGVQEAIRDFGADEAYPSSEFLDKLKAFLADAHALYMKFGNDHDFERVVFEQVAKIREQERKGVFAPKRFFDITDILSEMRLIKEKEEIETLKKACQITGIAFKSAMQAVRPGIGEWELQAVFEFEIKRRGGKIAFDTVCASGANATVLHYSSNSCRIGGDGLVLLDAGGEVSFMASDVTRTFPVDGRFKEPWLSVYKWVLRAQGVAIETLRGGVTYAQVHESALECLCDGLRALGVLKGATKEIIEEKRFEPYFMHRIGHYLGLDVHDEGAYFVKDGQSRPLKAGMVITIEPGLYFPVADFVPEYLRGIGVRIEDDCLVTRNGCEVLTKDIPKEPEDVERFMASGSFWDKLSPASIEKSKI
jgi:Xaa-Pro aminopeptidase